MLFRAIMRLSNELVYSGALQCANDNVACARLHTSVNQKQVAQLISDDFICIQCIYIFRVFIVS